MRVLIDANILLYAYDVDSPHHEAAREWFEERVSSGEPVRLAEMTILAFVRIASDPRVYEFPMSVPGACHIVNSWLELANVEIVRPGAQAWRVLAETCAEASARGALVIDAHLAALAKEHGAEIATADKDFRRFGGIRTMNPLAGGAAV